MSTQVTLFKNTHGNVHVALKSGRTVAFINGKFFTKEAALETELMQAAQTGEFGIYIDAEEQHIDPEFATPMDQLKKKLRDELMEELKTSGRLVDAGTSTQGPLQLQSTASVTGQAELTAEQRALIEEQRAAMEGRDQGETIAANENQTTQPEPGIAKLSAAEEALAKLKANSK